MAIDAEDRDQDQVDLVQQAALAVEGDVAQQHHARVLAVDLARMDAGLGQQHRLLGIELGAVLRRDHRIDRPPLRRDAELLDADQVRRRVQPVEPFAGVDIVGAEVVLGIGLERRHPRIGLVADQRLARALPLRGGRQEGLVPGGF
jgi:hypothetical protein